VSASLPLKQLPSQSVSHWFDDLGPVEPLRAQLSGDTICDVCIVGAGFTGLWCAYYLAKSSPSLKIVVLEQAYVGYGASGRNGGHLAAYSPWPRDTYIKDSGLEATLDLERCVAQSVDEVLRVCSAEQIDCDIVRGGALTIATNESQLSRLNQRLELFRQLGYSDDEVSLLSRDETLSRVAVAGAQGAVFLRNSARTQPARLVKGLAKAVERLGVKIFEATPVESISGRLAVTKLGHVRADTTIRATEGYTSTLKGLERTWLPLRTSMIVTERIPEALWRSVGWSNCEMLATAGHAGWYAQRTRAGRITFGGRGTPYFFGSRIVDGGNADQQAKADLAALFRQYFPQLSEIRIDRAWSGVMGVPRDWCGSVGYDAAAGIAWAGGYVGGGLAASNLAGRCIRDLVLRIDSDLTRLPWINRSAPRWELEPLRWLGVNAVYQLYDLADRDEDESSAKYSAFARLADKLSA
jgi:glycine/D-amino acid oxidase-like deaminating enzyme